MLIIMIGIASKRVLDMAQPVTATDLQRRDELRLPCTAFRY